MLVTGVGTTGPLQHMTGGLQRHASPQPNIQDHIMDYGCNKTILYGWDAERV